MRRRWWAKFALGTTSAVLALVLAGEGGLRVLKPAGVRLFDPSFSGEPGERMVKIDRRLEVHPDAGIFELDPVLGYRPVLGGKGYGPHGCKWNEYALEKPADKRRLLFLGDSVTDRHKIVDALHAALGESFEYWNAGVPAFATEQELLYYRDVLGGVHADHVLLTFHLNDYETTPILFEVDGELVSVHSKIGGTYPNAWLLRNSYLYRYAWTWRVSRTSVERARALEEEVERGLRGLRDLVAERGARFTVLVLPWLDVPARWPAMKTHHHERTLATLAALGIEHYAFLGTLERALAAGVGINESGTDPQHPSEAFARMMVEDLLAAGFEP